MWLRWKAERQHWKSGAAQPGLDPDKKIHSGPCQEEGLREFRRAGLGNEPSTEQQIFALLTCERLRDIASPRPDHFILGMRKGIGTDMAWRLESREPAALENRR